MITVLTILELLLIVFVVAYFDYSDTIKKYNKTINSGIKNKYGKHTNAALKASMTKGAAEKAWSRWKWLNVVYYSIRCRLIDHSKLGFCNNCHIVYDSLPGSACPTISGFVEYLRNTRY